jgi:hypothetical protein
VSAPATPGNPVTESHLLGIAGLGISLVLLRLVAVTGYDLTASQRILSALNIGQLVNILLGWALAHPSWVGYIAALFTVLLAANVPPSWHAVLGSHVRECLAACAFLFVSWRLDGRGPLLLGAGGLIVVVAIKVHRDRGNQACPRAESLLALYAVAMYAGLAGLTAAAALDPTPWVSAERIESHRYTGAGYVLGMTGGRLVVLTRDKHVLYLPASAFPGDELAALAGSPPVATSTTGPTSPSTSVSPSGASTRPAIPQLTTAATATTTP